MWGGSFRALLAPMVTWSGHLGGRFMLSHACCDRGALRQMLCLLLCACSWRGPVPVMHHHDQMPSQPAVQQSHLAVFHSDADDTGSADWHWHFVLPQSLPTDLPDSPATRTVPEFLSLACCFVMGGELLNTATIPEFWKQAVVATEFPLVLNVRQAADRDPDRPRSFLSSLSTAVPVVALTGVAVI